MTTDLLPDAKDWQHFAGLARRVVSPELHPGGPTGDLREHLVACGAPVPEMDAHERAHGRGEYMPARGLEARYMRAIANRNVIADTISPHVALIRYERLKREAGDETE